MKLHELKEVRAAKIAEAQKLCDSTDGALGGEARARFDQLTGEIDALSSRLSDAEKLAEYERIEARADQVSGHFSRDISRRYSLAKAVSESMSDRLTGIEAEAHQELSRDRTETRGIMVPTEILLETRDLTTTAPVDGPGGHLIQTTLGAMTDRRRARMLVESLGATVMRGLVGNVDLPRLAESATASFVAEHTDATRSTPKFSKVSMSPKTAAGEIAVSRRMLQQSSASIEGILRGDLGYMLAQKLDSVAIKGGGTDEPLGLLASATGLNKLTGTGDAQNPSFIRTTSDLMAALDMDDVTGTRAFLTSPKVTAGLRGMTDGNGHPYPKEMVFHNERIETTTQVQKESTGPDTWPVIYGEWASLYIGYWSGVDLLVNPYHSDVASKGGVLMHAFLDCDVCVRHPEGFAWAEVTA